MTSDGMHRDLRKLRIRSEAWLGPLSLVAGCVRPTVTGKTMRGTPHPNARGGRERSGRIIANLDRLVPFGRIGKPEEVAALVAFLASDEAAFMCGSFVEITGAQAVA
jgi:NAD(P)-dependent dehydrogenase (short-subunit alcohol dehydrogenase family)